jgi:hypothetical protein
VLTSCHQQGSSNATTMKEGEEDHPHPDTFTNYYNHYNNTNTNTPDKDPTEQRQQGAMDTEADEDTTMKGVEQQQAGSFTSGILAEALRKAYLSTTGDQVQGEKGKG